MERPVNVYCSYADQDEQLQKDLVKHLQALVKQNYIRVWDRSKIAPGMPFESEIRGELKCAQIILLLISSDYLAQQEEYFRIEWEQVMKRRADGDVRVIPIILRPVDWQIPQLEELKALPQGEISITTSPNQDEAFKNVVKKIRQIVEKDAPSEPVSQPSDKENQPSEPVSQITDKENRQPSKGTTSGAWATAIVFLVIFIIIGALSSYNDNQRNAVATRTAIENVAATATAIENANATANTVNATARAATEEEITSTAIADNVTATAETTPTPSPTPTPYPAYTNSQSPSGASFSAAAQQVILNAQLASKVNNNQSVVVTTTFMSGQTIYLSYQWAQGYTGYVQTRWWLNGQWVYTSITFNTAGGYGDFWKSFSVNSGTEQGTVEVFWCQDSACTTGGLAYARPFSVMAWSSSAG